MAPKVLGPEKLLKKVNYQNYQKTVLSQLEKVGGYRYPPRLGSPSQTRVKHEVVCEREMKIIPSRLNQS
jgi:hypothetical protein